MSTHHHGIGVSVFGDDNPIFEPQQVTDAVTRRLDEMLVSFPRLPEMVGKVQVLNMRDVNARREFKASTGITDALRSAPEKQNSVTAFYHQQLSELRSSPTELRQGRLSEDRRQTIKNFFYGGRDPGTIPIGNLSTQGIDMAERLERELHDTGWAGLAVRPNLFGEGSKKAKIVVDVGQFIEDEASHGREALMRHGVTRRPTNVIDQFQRTLTHELGHTVDFLHHQTMGKPAEALGTLRGIAHSNLLKYPHIAGSNMVAHHIHSHYARTNPAEAFAESIAALYHEPENVTAGMTRNIALVAQEIQGAGPQIRKQTYTEMFKGVAGRLQQRGIPRMGRALGRDASANVLTSAARRGLAVRSSAPAGAEIGRLAKAAGLKGFWKRAL